MTSSAYVFIEGLDTKPVICGKFEYVTATNVGRFVYGKSYLARDDAFAIDPLHLPLSNDTQTCLINNGIFGVLSDAGADAWGRKLITQLHATQPQNELEFLIAGAGMGVGAISFSLSRHQSKRKHSRNHMGHIELLRKGKNEILASERVTDEVKQAFLYGSSMGGARPKTLIIDGEHEYIAKFNKPDDLFNVARVEHATMRMLDEMEGTNVASTQVLSSGGEDVLLVERFDRHNDQVTHHFISANSLLLKSAVNKLSLQNWYSYGRLAEFLRQHSVCPDDAREIYTRLVFNVFIGNTDDHARNHACLYSMRERIGWQLSPAYDVLPASNSKQHSLGIGEQGRVASESNLLSQASRFGLKPSKAQQVINQGRELVAEWPAYMRKYNVEDGDIQRLRSVIPNIEQ